jgi:phosphoglucomutase
MDLNSKQIQASYKEWLENIDDKLVESLKSINQDELSDAFYQNLSFGTGGLRGKLGLGPNRMNIYTVGKATQGLADYLNANFSYPSVVLCRDTRHGGKEFVKYASEVLAANGIKSYLYERVEPTPTLSFAVRELGCSAGINITASHNPAAYNGYKVYGPDGCQITVEVAKAIQQCINRTDIFNDVKRISYEEAAQEGLAADVPERVLDRYVEETLKLSTLEDCSDLRIAYTPLHGVGLECVSRVLKAANLAEFITVKEQTVQDGDFPTCPYPNPEIKDALELGLKLCDEEKPDLLLATDPDADRVGIAVPHSGSYVLMSGNEVGILLLDFLARKACEENIPLDNRVACTTIVSAPMADAVAQHYGFELRRTLTGFKFIGEQIGLLEAENRQQDFLFGFEESYGYLAGTAVRDKDAVVASMLICELTAYWKKHGKDLYEAMNDLYEQYGYWGNVLLSVGYEGPEGAQQMSHIMERLRENKILNFEGIEVAEFIDYAQQTHMPIVNGSGAPQVLPIADVIEFKLVDESLVIIRPSGTEPKIKAYVFAKAMTRNAANEKVSLLANSANKILEGESA